LLCLRKLQIYKIRDTRNYVGDYPCFIVEFSTENEFELGIEVSFATTEVSNGKCEL
ncbi:hypothetical protein PanWU01x14_306120, partial [Parasponia andersonii]